MTDPRWRPELRALQERFLTLVTTGIDVEAAIAAHGFGADGVAFVRSDARAGAVDRLDVYAQMYFARLVDALHEDFPRLAAVLGDDAFVAMARDYLQAWPSTSPAIREVGARLPAYLRSSAAAYGPGWLGDLAALEWARVDVFDRADAEPLSLEALRALEPETVRGPAAAGDPRGRARRGFAGRGAGLAPARCGRARRRA